MILASSVIVVVAATVFFTLFVRLKDIPPPNPFRTQSVGGFSSD